jgi:pre-60S factor REI1
LAGAAVNERDCTAPETGQIPASEWEIWDSKRSLFDNHMSTSFEENVEYMYKSFGFHFPDWEYLQDPEGLLQYVSLFLMHIVGML